MSETADIHHLRQWIGAEDEAEDWLTPSLAERFAATLGLSAAGDGEVAPRLIHFCLCQPAPPIAALGEDGHPARGGFLPPVPLPRRMWAGSDIRFSGDLRVGDRVTRRSRVADVVLKTGATGALCFVIVDHAYSAEGKTLVEDCQTLVYRAPAHTGAPPPAPAPAGPGVLTEIVEPSPTLLFRYSALTFNGHRIHYDLNYATRVEGYPGLVVHGPLQATLLLHLAARTYGCAPDRFTFRAKSSLFHQAPIGVHAGPAAEGRMALWTATAGGPVAVEAEARWS